MLDLAILVPAIGQCFVKLNPRLMIRNPVMFVVEVVAALTTVIFLELHRARSVLLDSMVGIPSRHRSIFLLGGVVLLQILLLAVQIKRDSQGRLIRVWTVGAVSPFERVGAHGISHIRDTWNHYFALQNTSRENEELRRENGALKLQITQLQSKAGEADRLAALLNFGNRTRTSP